MAKAEAVRVSSELSPKDRWGAVRARLGIGRHAYTVSPGLYAVGNPSSEAPVFVSANYKLSFDCLRAALAGIAGWVLVLDTKGINVWCAAGKGTFGAEELVHRVAAVRLADVVSHRTLVVPQLGAPGVSAHDVKKRSGFGVVYGPVRAEDIAAFLGAGMACSPEMRRVRFDLRDRLAVVPVEVVHWGKYALAAAAALFFLGGLCGGGYAWDRVTAHGGRAAGLVLLAFFGGTVLVPLLLPWIPGRPFSLKGFWVGLHVAAAAVLAGWIPFETAAERTELAAWSLLIPAIVAFFGMNFTGSSTYTSLSGVRREMKIAVPAQIAAAAAGLGLWLWARFL